MTSRTDWFFFRKQVRCLTIPLEALPLNQAEQRAVAPPRSRALSPTAQDELLLRTLYQEAVTILLPQELHAASSVQQRQFRKLLQQLTHRMQKHNQELYTHALEVIRMTSRLLTTLNIPQEEAIAIRLAAFYHDIGKLDIAQELLNKPARLTAEEMDEVKKHAAYGAAMLGTHQALAPVATLIYHHHERWDGAGYPVGLQGTLIPPGSRMIAMIDAFSAMTSQRPYNKRCTPSEALNELVRCAGSQFDPLLVQCFCASQQMQPARELMREH